jgi:1,4-alpha-glucan branching enzyme
MLRMPGGKPLRGAVRRRRQLTKIVVRWFCLIAVAAGIGWSCGPASGERLSLGAIYTPQATTFSIWSPDSDDVKLFLEGQAQPIPMAKIPDTDQYADVYRVTVPGEHQLEHYNFLIRGKTVRDPYGVMVEPRPTTISSWIFRRPSRRAAGLHSRLWRSAKTR